LESNDLLVRAASRLEPLMAGDKSADFFKTSLVAQVSAAVYYKAHVVSKIMTNKAFQNKFRQIIFNQINKDFAEYIDAQARIKPKQFHHVYEWKRTGEASARLFKLKEINTNEFSLKLTYDFGPSKSFVPTSKGKHRHVFVNKASVMEAGMPVKIAPRAAERIVFDVGGYVVYMPKGASVTVTKPGGIAVKKSFESAYRRFFTTDLVNSSIKRSGFQKMFTAKVRQSIGVPSAIKTVKYSFSPNAVRSMADMAVAVGG
jgi:hypothetical protein